MNGSEHAGGDLRRHIRRRRRKVAAALGSVAVLAVATVGVLLGTHVIEVVVEPADAEAVLTREEGVLLTVGRRVLLYSDQGAVEVAADGFAPGRTVVSRNRAAKRLAVRLHALPGRVALEVDSAEEFLVRVDGRIVGSKPRLDIELAAGRHAVTIEGPRIRRFDEGIDVTGRGVAQTFSFSPVAAETVRFRVAAEPPFARILVDGVHAGTGVYRGELSPGVHELAVEADDYAPHRREVEIPPDARDSDLGTITLAPLPAVVSISSVPGGATVLIDGEYRGDSPLRAELAANRDYALSIRKTGFRQADDVLRPLPNARIERAYDLASATYQAHVTANRPAEIAVNGRIVGTAPVTVEVAADDRITAVAEGFVAKPVRVRPGGADTRRYAFKLLEPARFAYEEAADETTAPGGIRLRKFAPATFDARESEQSPPKEVELSRPFYFAVHETTVAAFRAFRTGFSPEGTADHPAVSVTWQDAARFCNWLSAAAGLPPAYVFGGAFATLDADSSGFRLPTEAEWEAVARYDFTSGRVRARPYAWGLSPTIPRAFANVAGRELRSRGVPFLADHVDNHAGLAPVGTYPPNFNGIHELAGNVSEWVNDYYRAGPFAPDARTDPLGPRTGTDHVVKGANHRSAVRAALSPGYRTFVANKSEHVGFRVARWIR